MYVVILSTYTGPSYSSESKCTIHKGQDKIKVQTNVDVCLVIEVGRIEAFLVVEILYFF